MAAPVAVGAGAVITALINSAGDVTEKGVEAVVKILETRIVLEFGAEGYKVGGRRRTRKSGPKDNPVRNRYDDRVTVRRIEVPLAAVFAVAWLAGWRPGGAIGKLFEFLLGSAKGEEGPVDWLLHGVFGNPQHGADLREFLEAQKRTAFLGQEGPIAGLIKQANPPPTK